MKRTKQAEKMIESINYYLKANNVKDPYDDVVMAFQYALQKANIYNGYAYQVRKVVGGNEILVFAKQGECECLQFL